jgi:hypothetical protein
MKRIAMLSLLLVGCAVTTVPETTATYMRPPVTTSDKVQLKLVPDDPSPSPSWGSLRITVR